MSCTYLYGSKLAIVILTLSDEFPNGLLKLEASLSHSNFPGMLFLRLWHGMTNSADPDQRAH